MIDNQVPLARIAVDVPGFDFEVIRQQRVPIILVGATETWPARQKWSLNYMAETLGEMEYMAEVNLPKDVPINYNLNEFQQKVRMKDFIQTVKSSRSDSASYITNKSIDRFPGLADDIKFGSLLGMPVYPELTRLWIGTANTKSSLHFDYSDNVLYQVVGQKRVYLIDPKHTSRLYQHASNIDKSQVDVEKADFNVFPKFRDVPVMEDVIVEGEILVIPMLWWHSLRSLSPSISINCFYGASAGARELMPMMWAGGARLVAAFIRDFFWSGVFRRPYKQLLYTAEPFGVWFYLQLRNSIMRRISRSGSTIS